jgi:hypothetical protein
MRLSVTALSYYAVSLFADDSMPGMPILAAGIRAASMAMSTRGQDQQEDDLRSAWKRPKARRADSTGLLIGRF